MNRCKNIVINLGCDRINNNEMIQIFNYTYDLPTGGDVSAEC